MARSRVRYGAIPVGDNGQEMIGTHGSVMVNGVRVPTHVVAGEYVSRETFIRYALRPYGTPGVTYRVLRGGFGYNSRTDGNDYAIPKENDK